MHKLVLLDIDGTIMSSSGAGRKAMKAAMRTVFGAHGPDSFRYDGKTDRQIVRESMRLEGFDDVAIDAKMDDVIGLYLQGLESTLVDAEHDVKIFAGISALVDEIHQRDDAVLGLLTGNVESGAKLKLGRVGIDYARFRVNAFGSDHEMRNALPAIARERMREAYGVELDGRDVIIVGDTPADIECARAIDARCIAVATGRYSVDELAQHDPYVVFPTLGDTEAVIRAIYA